MSTTFNTSPTVLDVSRSGLIATRTSGVLCLILDKQLIKDEYRDALLSGINLLDDIISGEDLYGYERKGAMPSHSEVEAFDNALNVIIDNKEDFPIDDIENIAPLLTEYKDFLNLLFSSNVYDEKIHTTIKINNACKFFDNFTKLLLTKIPQSIM